MECKIFKEYFGGFEKFCNRIFNYFWKYIEGKVGEDCMIFWLNGMININKKVVVKYVW